MAMNGRLNCILEICCGAAAALDAMVDQMVEDTGLDPVSARKACTWAKKNFDHAPKGSLVAFKAEVARLARQPQSPPGKNL